ncbi:hypothetical protein Pmani_005215 [Petrolisthes manimaculis]|uniref:Caspase family p20 domain-containing protein n=1 Tax=Petrolisthes manimaculis TaxID=1843537 RepID=A0AAE1UGX7_9EUCA|nr:hypothetical protein Pmani_005215 [Petrolisthes manimaculis]
MYSQPVRSVVPLTHTEMKLILEELSSLPRQFHSSVRQGSEEDVQNFNDLFTQMGYTTVEVLNDAGKKETRIALERFRDQKILEEVDSLVVIFMSHGRKGDVFLTSDDEEMTCEEVIESFSNYVSCSLWETQTFFVSNVPRSKGTHSS